MINFILGLFIGWILFSKRVWDFTSWLDLDKIKKKLKDMLTIDF